MSTGRVVIGGSTGFMGRFLVPRFRAEGREVVTISRSGADIRWGYQVEIDRAVEELIQSAGGAEDRPMTESTGEVGSGFSVEVAKAWEKALFADELPATRRVALRSTIVLGHGGVLGPVRDLARFGLGGSQYDGRWPVSAARRAAGTGHLPGARRGRQRFSWVHIEDVARIIDFLERNPALEGPVNAASPHPVDNVEFMATVRRALGARIGVPMPRWMLELGAIGMRTETELILKSRWVLPEMLTEAGFEFRYPFLEDAIRESFDLPPADQGLPAA